PTIVRGDPTYGLVIRTLGELRNKWDELENEQRRFLADLGEADLWRPLDGKTPEGRTFSRPLGMLLLHVPTHAAHHRSELATMLTMTSGERRPAHQGRQHARHASRRRLGVQRP